jgi:hypothetical protein
MNCHGFLAQLDEYMTGELEPRAIEAAGAHLRACSGCQRQLARRHELRAILRSQAVPPPRPEFFEQALLHARRSGPARFAFGARLAGAALAASLALWIGFGWLPGSQPESGKFTGIVIALHETQTVQLAFNAEQVLTGATLRIRLPDGVELRGFPGQREIHWRTDLARGVNMLSLPLTAVAASEGTLLARLEHGERNTEFAVRLRVSKPLSSGAGTAHPPVAVHSAFKQAT